jgi:DNA-binding NtrC family response regulator
MNRILVIEDEQEIRCNVLDLLDAEGFRAEGAADGSSGLRAARAHRPDLILCDITMPGMDGYEVLRALREDRDTAGIPFIFLTARTDRSHLRTGMSLGADDYLTKPFARGELLDAIHTRLRRFEVVLDGGSTKPPSSGGYRRSMTPLSFAAVSDESMVVEDPAMRALHRLVEKIAPGTINVVLLGETGVGKEIFAERIHQLSPRRDRPLVRLNCSAFTESLLESELFGHEKGSFTGATHAKPGLLESAEGGTVFLDEVGDLALPLQAKLLRVLEERMVRRIGALQAIPIDVRFVSATNRNLEEDVARGRFRGDLYFRLGGVALTIPPLRERVAEIELLAVRFLAHASRKEGRAAVPSLSPEAVALLLRQRWPGNVRELRNVIERAVLLADGDVITPEHLPFAAPPTSPIPEPGSLRGTVELAERQRIIHALAACDGNQTEAAKMLGIARRTLINKVEQYGLPRPRKA